MSPVAAPAALADVSTRIATIQAHIQSVSSTATPSAPATQQDSGSTASEFAAALDGAVANGTVAGSSVTDTTTVPRTTAVRDVSPASDATAASKVAAAATPSANNTVTGADVVTDAKKYLGVPYVWGGESTSGLDCSGLVQLTYNDLGIDLPRVSRDQAKAGTPVASLDQARPGDLVAFGNPVHHIGIYLGDGKMIEAPEAGKTVQITDMSRTPSAIRRIIPTDGESAATAPHHGSGIDVSAATADTTAAGTALPSVSAPAATTLTAPPGFPDMWNDAQLAGIPRAVPLSSIGITAASAPTATSGTADALTTSDLQSAGISPAVARFLDDFTAARSAFDLPQGLLPAVAQAESGGDPDAVSSAGAEGLMQLMPSTAAGLGVTDPFDPQQSIAAAANLLSQHLSTFDGSIPKALAAYNAGAGAVEQYGGVPPYAETQHYVDTITDMLARLS